MLATLGGCAGGPQNPSFPLTTKQADADLAEMHEHPVPLARPVVVLGGYNDPGVAASTIRDVLERAVGDDKFVLVSFGDAKTFAECRARVIEAVEKAYPDGTTLPSGRRETVEVDVVANSLGGLVGRYAAMWPADAVDPATDAADPTANTRLYVRRMFTLLAPHQGAAMADPKSDDELMRDMAIGSAFIAMLDTNLPSGNYELVSYGRLGDLMVGVEHTAPPGVTPHWVPGHAIEPSHLSAFGDRRILADIARQLRGEPPYTIDPPSPIPTDGH